MVSMAFISPKSNYKHLLKHKKIVQKIMFINLQSHKCYDKIPKYMKKYSFPKLTDILNVKVGTKRVWEERVKNQTILTHLLEDSFETSINLKAFSFYPNKLYFGTPLTSYPEYVKKNIPFYEKIINIFESHRWNIYAAYQHVNPYTKLPNKFSSFKELDFDHTEVLLSEIILMDLNNPSHGVGQEVQLSLFQPLIGFSKNRVSRMVKGRPGSLILNYKTDDELFKILEEIAKRKSFSKEPFYIKKCANHPFKTIFKGKICLNCKYKNNLHE